VGWGHDQNTLYENFFSIKKISTPTLPQKKKKKTKTKAKQKCRLAESGTQLLPFLLPSGQKGQLGRLDLEPQNWGELATA